MAVLAERCISLTENAVEKRGIWYKHGNCPEFSCLYMSFRDSLEFRLFVENAVEIWGDIFLEALDNGVC